MSKEICCDLPSREVAADTKKRCAIKLIYFTYLNATQWPSRNDLFNFVLILGFVLCFLGLFATDDFKLFKASSSVGLRHDQSKISVKDVQRSRCLIQVCSFCFLLF